MCVAIASISGGDRQSYGSSLSSLSRLRTAPMFLGSAADSLIEETNAPNSGGAQPGSDESSVCTKSSPKNGCLSLSMRPYIWTPQPEHAQRLIVAFGSTTWSFDSFAVTLTLSRGITATCENNAPDGFQHFVQP